MRKADWIARHSRHPTGVVGTFVARAMARTTARENDQAVEAFAPRPGEALIEIGSGHGRTLSLIADAVSTQSGPRRGFVAGVDPSAVMCREAVRRNAARIASGLVAIEEGTADAIPFPDERFDGALSVACLHFWDDLEDAFAEIRRVLLPTARLLVVYSPVEDPVSKARLPDSIYRLRGIAEVEEAAGRSGFVDVETVRVPRGKGFAAWLRANAGDVGAS